jgi:hypothetical protein
VRGDVEQYHEPKVWFSAAAEKFVKDVLILEPKRLALKMESYVVAGLDKGNNTCTVVFMQCSQLETGRCHSMNLGRKTVVSQCRQIIQEGLGKYFHSS